MNDPTTTDTINSQAQTFRASKGKKRKTHFLQDPRLGQTADERQTRYVQLSRWAKSLNGATVCITLWALFWPAPQPLAIYACCLLPWLALAAVLFSKNMIRLGVDADDAFPDVRVCFLMPGVVLALRAVLDYNILSWQNFWPGFAVVSLAFCLCALYVAGGFGTLNANAVGLLFFCATYAYASVICLNAVTDRSLRTVYQAQVLDKRVSKGKHDSYYLLLSPWGDRSKAREIDVGKRVYDRYRKGDTASVVVRKGRFKIPWFFVE